LKRTLLAAAMIAALASPASASGANSGEITGVTIDASGTAIRIQNVRVTTDSCPFFDEFAGFTTCGAEAGLVPASQTCPSQGTGMLHLWSAGQAATGAGRTMNSGSLVGAVPTPSQYRVCAYLLRASENFGENRIFVAEALSPVPSPPQQPPATGPPASPAADPPAAPSTQPPASPPTLSPTLAKQSAKSGLAKRFGKSYRKGKRRKLSCKRSAPTKIRCKANWRYDGKRRKASVVVTLIGGKLKARLT
jgi:hypothetical protein